MIKQYLLRATDILLSILGLLVTAPIQVVICIIGLFDTGSPLFIQRRVGKGQQPFTLIKFRTMKQGTASTATHLASADAITPFGRFLRRTKLDELPQLINVLKGDMSLVGPRPCLFNQLELIDAREKNSVFNVLPGITGLAQVNGIDMSDPQKLADWDQKMIQSLTFNNYFKYLLFTLVGKGAGDRVRNG